MSRNEKEYSNVNILDRKTANNFMDKYLDFAKEMRPDLAMIEVL